MKISREGGATLSVVIPTRNRCASLDRTLRGLDAQTYPLRNVEVVVVLDGSTDGSAEMVRRRAAPYTLHVVEQPGIGCGGARTYGASRASGRLILFLDDDIEPTLQLLERHVHAHQSEPSRVVVGYSPPARQGARGDFLREELQAWWHEKFGAMAAPGHRYRYRDLLGGNLSLPRELFLRMGGFDPDFSPLCFEDHEFAMRLIKADIPFAFAPDAVAHHHEHETATLKHFLHRKRQEGRADVLLGRRHPELRPSLATASARGASFPVDWTLCVLAFVWPALTERICATIRPALGVLQHHGLRSMWRSVFRGLHRTLYWRGVAQELGNLRALREFHQEPGSPAGTRPLEIALDLRQGLDEAERRLDREKPFGVRITYGPHIVGRIPPEPGAERLRGSHLRPLLASTLAERLRRAISAESAIPADEAIRALLEGRDTVHSPHRV